MKKGIRLNILLSIATLLFASCSSNGDKDYKVSKSDYEEQMNIEYVLFSSNYTINAYKDGQHYFEDKFDHGKILTHFENSNPTYYGLTDNGDTILVNIIYVNSDGSIYETNETTSKATFYSYFFYDYGILFSIPYEAMTYNSQLKQYEIKDYKISLDTQVILISSGALKFYKNNPVSFEFNINLVGSLSLDFTDNGTTVVNKPTQPEKEAIVLQYTYTCQESELNKLSDSVAAIVGGLGIQSFSITFKPDKILVVTINEPLNGYSFVALVDYCIVHNSYVAVSNAHDTFVYRAVEPDKRATIVNDDVCPTIVVPLNNESDTFEKMLQETRNDIINKNTEYAESYYDMSEEEEEQLYYYYLYFWLDFDPTICRFEFINDRETSQHLFIKADVTVDNSMFYNNEPYNLKLAVPYQDLNGDGVLSEPEIEVTNFQAKAITCLLNKVPNNYGLERYVEQ